MAVMGFAGSLPACANANVGQRASAATAKTVLRKLDVDMIDILRTILQCRLSPINLGVENVRNMSKRLPVSVFVRIICGRVT
jgi:hypothetical protein